MHQTIRGPLDDRCNALWSGPTPTDKRGAVQRSVPLFGVAPFGRLPERILGEAE